jgi:hypothetical protein
MRRRSLLAGGTTALLAALCPRTGRSAADGTARQYELTELRYQGWAGRVTFPELAEDLGYLAPIRLK